MDKVQRTQDKVQQERNRLLPASFVLLREVARVFLSQRCRRPEVMDQPGLSPDRHVQALGGLARINFWSGSAGILWPPLRDLSRRVGGRLRLLDLASGGGDVPIRLWHRARRAGLDWDVQGCDVSPVAVAYAQKAAQRTGAGVRFFVYDALNGPPLEPQDAVINSLFLHHLDEEQAVHFLRRMAGMADRLVLVNDLVRNWTGLALAYLGTRLLSASPVVHTDGPRSVAGAFTPAEARALAEQAGLHGATVTRHWPCRYLLTFSKRREDRG